MKPMKPALTYLRFVADLPPGLYDNPHVGQIQPGRVYQVNAQIAQLFSGHPDWEPADKQAFTTQDEED